MGSPPSSRNSIPTNGSALSGGGASSTNDTSVDSIPISPLNPKRGTGILTCPLIVSSVTLGHEPIGMDLGDSEDEDPPCNLRTHSIEGMHDLLTQIAKSDQHDRELLASWTSTSTSEQTERKGSLFRRISQECRLQ